MLITVYFPGSGLSNTALHPIIRLACFISLVSGLALTKGSFLVIATPILLILLNHYSRWSQIYPLLKRLRWLFLSLFILYGWFQTPDFSWLPSETGLRLAFERIFALILIVLAAHLLLITTPIETIIVTLQWWLQPLKRLNFPSDLLAVRLALVLETIETLRLHYPKSQPSPLTNTNPFQKIAHRLAQVWLNVWQQAESEPLRQLCLPHLTAPPWWQWSYPLGLIFLIIIT